MFQVGDIIIYSAHGICHIDNICEKTFGDITKKYYELHPLADCKLRINVPVDNNKLAMLELMSKCEAEEILESFRTMGVNWIDTNTERNQIYSGIVKTGNRKEITKIVNTLMRKKYIAEVNGKRFCEQDNRLLISIKNILFAEIAMTLGTTIEDINDKVISLISISEKGLEESKGFVKGS